MAIIERTYGKETNAVIDELLISSDSHVIEPAGLWQKQLPKAFQDVAGQDGCGLRPWIDLLLLPWMPLGDNETGADHCG